MTATPSRLRRPPASGMGEAMISAASAGWLKRVTAEEILTHPLFFGLATASPVQRAFCRAADGTPLEDLATDPTVQESFACNEAQLRALPRPAELAGVAGIRTYKSGIAAVLGTHAALRCDATGLRPGEFLRVPIVSVKLENAKAVYTHLAGAWTSSPILKPMLVTDPWAASDRFTVERPDGTRVEFLCIAGSRAGAGLVSFWLAAIVFDEYARMTGDAQDGVINWKEQRAAVIHRVRPGGYLVHISSPYGEFGPAHDHIEKSLGKPTREVVVIRARADHMNPVYWTPERCEEARQKDPESYLTDVLARELPTEAQFFHPDTLTKATRPATHVVDGQETDWIIEPPLPRNSYTAAGDPATRGNGWTLAIATREGERRRLVYAREWRGTPGKPLDPDVVLREQSVILKEYGCDSIASDQWAGDALASLARQHGIRLTPYALTGKEIFWRYMSVKTRLELRQDELCASPLVRRDMLNVQRVLTADGPRIVLKQTNDGRHADFAPAVVLALTRTCDDMRPVELTEAQREEQRAIENALRSYREENGQEEDY